MFSVILDQRGLPGTRLRLHSFSLIVRLQRTAEAETKTRLAIEILI